MMSHPLSMKEFMSNLFSVRGIAKTLSFAAVLAMSTAIPAQAASACKGKSKIMCESSNSCSYVKAHKRKDGAKVKAFCRAKPGKSKASSKRYSKSSKKMSLIDDDGPTTRSKKSKTSKTSKTPKTSKKSKTSRKSTASGAKKKTTRKTTARKSSAKKKTSTKKKTNAKKKS